MARFSCRASTATLKAVVAQALVALGVASFGGNCTQVVRRLSLGKQRFSGGPRDEAGRSLAERFGLMVTPTVIINRYRSSGVLSADELNARIDSLVRDPRLRRG